MGKKNEFALMAEFRMTTRRVMKEWNNDANGNDTWSHHGFIARFVGIQGLDDAGELVRRLRIGNRIKGREKMSQRRLWQGTHGHA
jgi:hypothetical protein